jgi:hypothetical protein
MPKRMSPRNSSRCAEPTSIRRLRTGSLLTALSKMPRTYPSAIITIHLSGYFRQRTSAGFKLSYHWKSGLAEPLGAGQVNRLINYNQRLEVEKAEFMRKAEVPGATQKMGRNCFNVVQNCIR